ncbi:L,D-transpeptidase family protein [Vibrio methylphosphonaticus]|uniref:L,D-transpeptidase family protein n=1 Tax=Vibrio methylphosphonaticus TaxID=2946866 RepID=UPI00202A4C41|nr:L,D-transpeptidase family protein [Vibrio methylphosphonaticus]MCL9775852.1 L,D-transpeptidase family protein [Vibrio methylphosphonaticus]
MSKQLITMVTAGVACSLAVPVWATPDQVINERETLSAFAVDEQAAYYDQRIALSAPVLSSSIPKQSGAEDLLYASLVDYVYSETGRHNIWSNNELNAQLNLQLEMLKLAGFSPLFERRVNRMQSLYQSDDFADYDRAATDTLLLYISYAAAVPELGKQWYFSDNLIDVLPRPSATEVHQLLLAIEDDTLADYLLSISPPMLQQTGFENAYIDLVAKSQVELTTYEQAGLTRKGDKLEPESYMHLLDRLADSELYVEVRKDSLFDQSLEYAIKEFQRLYGLEDDGIIGPNTLLWLNKPAQEKLRVLALNAERSRLWPQQREHIILVNVPSFELKYWGEGEARFESRVIVGRLTRQTPIFETKMDSLIVNPTWNVPWKIMVKDIIPKVKNDPTYLFSQRIEILEGWHNRVTVDPTMINWKEVQPKQFPYRMRQQAGVSNALGQYKFNTPNERAIFLHDTPGKQLFNESSRAYSSGCVRVEHADKFAQVLLEHQGKLLDDLSTYRANKAISFKTRIPVHIIYQTAWLEDGKAHFRADVYQYDNRRGSVTETASIKN